MKSKCFKTSNENLFELDEEDVLGAYGIRDVVKKQIEKVKKFLRCTRSVVDAEIKTRGSDLQKVFAEFKAMVDKILTDDTKKCGAIKGLKEKFL